MLRDSFFSLVTTVVRLASGVVRFIWPARGKVVRRLREAACYAALSPKAS